MNKCSISIGMVQEFILIDMYRLCCQIYLSAPRTRSGQVLSGQRLFSLSISGKEDLILVLLLLDSLRRYCYDVLLYLLYFDALHHMSCSLHSSIDSFALSARHHRSLLGHLHRSCLAVASKVRERDRRLAGHAVLDSLKRCFNGIERPVLRLLGWLDLGAAADLDQQICLPKAWATRARCWHSRDHQLSCFSH